MSELRSGLQTPGDEFLANLLPSPDLAALRAPPPLPAPPPAPAAAPAVLPTPAPVEAPSEKGGFPSYDENIKDSHLQDLLGGKYDPALLAAGPAVTAPAAARGPAGGSVTMAPQGPGAAAPSRNMVGPVEVTGPVPAGVTPLMAPDEARRRVDLAAVSKIADPLAEAAVEQLNKGMILGSNYLPYQIKGSEADPMRKAQMAAAGGTTVNATINGKQVTIPYDQYYRMTQEQPELLGMPPSGSGGASAAPPGGPAAGAGPIAASGGPIAAPTAPNQPQVIRPDHGAIIIKAPAAVAPSGTQVGTPYFPPGAETAIGSQMTDDLKKVDQLNTEATSAQSKLALINGIQGALANVYTGATGPTRDEIGQRVLKPLGFSDDQIKNWVGTNPTSANYLDKGLIQLVTDQMGSVPQGGYGVMQEISRVFPSKETQPGAINMLLNSLKMSAQRTMDLRDQAQAYQQDSRDNYISNPGANRYSPLSNFLSQFDKANPATNYYRAAQAMTPEFAKEVWTPGDTYDPTSGTASPRSQDFLRHMPAGSTFYTWNGKPVPVPR